MCVCARARVEASSHPPSDSRQRVSSRSAVCKDLKHEWAATLDSSRVEWYDFAQQQQQQQASLKQDNPPPDSGRAREEWRQFELEQEYQRARVSLLLDQEPRGGKSVEGLTGGLDSYDNSDPPGPPRSVEEQPAHAHGEASRPFRVQY